MHHLSLVYALLVSATGAIPLEDSPFPGASKWTPNHQIQPGDVIVPVNGVCELSFRRLFREHMLRT
jgi:hypothetical protein